MLSTVVLIAAASPLLPATHHDGIVSADMPVHPEASEALIAKATGCPAKMKGVLFSHISKSRVLCGSNRTTQLREPKLSCRGERARAAGGTAAAQLVEGVFRPVSNEEHTVKMFNDDGKSCQPLSHESASKYFTIGLVRKPCDWMLSAFIQEAGTPYEHLAIPTDESRAAFKAWVSRSTFARSSMHMSCLRPRGPAPDHTRSHRRPRTLGTRSRLPCRRARVTVAGEREHHCQVP